jgi:hypothetical protein
MAAFFFLPLIWRPAAWPRGRTGNGGAFPGTEQGAGVFKKKPAPMSGCAEGCMQNARWPFIPSVM